MNEPHAVFRIEGLGKRYRIGERGGKANTLGGACLGALRRDDASHLWALRDVHLEVRRGDVLGLVGPNGAGKTTLLRILARITSPTTGQVRLRGRVGSLLEIGTGFHPELTGRENVYLGGAVLGLTRDEIRRRFDEIVEFAGVGRYLEAPVKRYSTGMHVRLAFSVAAHLEAEVLLVDEVLAVGDLEFQARCLGRMNTLADEGRTVVFVSHNMAAVHDLCTRGVLLEGGRVAHEGDVSSTIAAYREAQVATLRDAASSTFEVEGPRLAAHDHGVLPVGATIEIETLVTARALATRPHLELYVMDAKGDRVLSYRQDLEDLAGHALPVGATHRVGLSLPAVWLAPGTYALRGTLTWRDHQDEAKEIPLPGQPLVVAGQPTWERALLAPPAQWVIR